MKAILVLILFISCSNPVKEKGVSQLRSTINPGTTFTESAEIVKIQTTLKINTDSINSMRGRVRVMEGLLVKQQAALAKKDTVWTEGFGGYGTKFQPLNQTAVKNRITVLEKNIVDLKTALAAIRTDISASKTRLGLLEKNVTNLITALAAIRKDIADIKAKQQ